MMILARTDPSHPTGLLCILFLVSRHVSILNSLSAIQVTRPPIGMVSMRSVCHSGSFGELKFTMSFQNLIRVMEALGPDYKFHGAEAAKVRASECVR